MKLHGYIGIAIIVLAELLLFSGNQFVGNWFTAIVWTGYILFIDALVFRWGGRSLLVTNRVEFLIIIICSMAIWWLFEFYNAPRFWKSNLELWWHYHNLNANPYIRRVGYDWAFSTILPAMFLTAQLATATLFRKVRAVRSLRLSPTLLYILIGVGGLSALLPLVLISAWSVPLVWLSFILLLDPINYFRGWPSIVADVSQGNYRRLLSLLVAGGLCGLLWEFWNYWALTKWTYTVPYLGTIKIFEMPVLGYLAFPPFAVECWVMYIFLRSLLAQRSAGPDFDEIGIWPAGHQ